MAIGARRRRDNRTTRCRRMTLFVLAYAAGLLTVASPCMFPILPFVLARAETPFGRGGLPMLIGLALLGRSRALPQWPAVLCNCVYGSRRGRSVSRISCGIVFVEWFNGTGPASGAVCEARAIGEVARQ